MPALWRLRPENFSKFQINSEILISRIRQKGTIIAPNPCVWQLVKKTKCTSHFKKNWKKFGELFQPLTHQCLGAGTLSKCRVLELNHSSIKEPQLTAVLGIALRASHTRQSAPLFHTANECFLHQYTVVFFSFFFTVTDRNDQLKSSSLVDKAQRKMVAALEKERPRSDTCCCTNMAVIKELLTTGRVYVVAVFITRSDSLSQNSSLVFPVFSFLV